MKVLKFLLVTTIIFVILILMGYSYSRYIEPNLLTITTEKLESTELKVPLKIVFLGTLILENYMMSINWIGL